MDKVDIYDALYWLETKGNELVHDSDDEKHLEDAKESIRILLDKINSNRIVE